MLVKNYGFWVVVYAFLVSIALVWVSVSYYNHTCPTADLTEIESKLTESQNKIYYYEKVITQDSLIIWNSSRAERDSLRAIRFNKYLHGDTLHR